MHHKNDDSNYTPKFSDELKAFAYGLENIPNIKSNGHSLSGWKQLQYSIIDDIYSNLGKLSISFKELYNSPGPFIDLLACFENTRKELASIIESEIDYADFIGDKNLAKIRSFLNKANSFISLCVVKINEYRNMYNEINASLHEINDKIFVVHSAEKEVIRFIKKTFYKTKYNVYVLEEQTTDGMQYVFEKFEEFAKPCGFAIVLLFADDVEKPVFRPNVLFELGYFLNMLGKKNVMLISNCSEDKIPSDIRGIYLYKTANKNWKKEIKSSLIKRGFAI